MLNKRSFIYQAGLLASSNLLLLLLNFIYRILLGRLAGPEGLGIYTLVMQVYGIVMSVCVSGLCVAVTHTAAGLHQKGDYRGLQKMIRFAIACFLALLACMALPIITFRDAIAIDILGDARTARALVLIVACIFLTGVENITKALFNGIRQVKYSAISEVGEQSIRILLAALVLGRLMNGDHGWTAFLILGVMTLSEVYSVVFLGTNYFRRIVRHKKSSANMTSGIRRRFLKMAIPSASTAILANVFSSVATIIFPQRLLLAGYTHVQAVSALGLLSGMVQPVLMLPSAVIMALCTLMMPSISACVERGDEKDLKRKVDKGIEAAGLLGISSTLLLLPFVPLICLLLFGQTVPVSLVAVMAVEAMVSYYLMLSISILNGLGKQKQVLLFAAISELVQLALVWVLTAIPTLHVYGYLLGMLIGDVLRATLGFIWLHRVTGTRPRLFHSFVVPVACAAILYCCVRMLFFQFVAWGVTILAALLLSFACCILIYLLLLRLMGVRVGAYVKRVAFMQSGEPQ